MWAPVAATTYEQALYYGKFYDENGEQTNTQKMTNYLSKLDTVINNLGFEYDISNTY